MSAAAFNLYKPQNTCCIIVGLGLIGQSISQYLGLFGERVQPETIHFSWNNATEITEGINHLLQLSGRKQLELIWSGGYAGFSASDSEMEKEYNVFTRTMENLVKKHGTNLSINFLSSAGGIYEGIENIKAIDETAPVRPYGIWKLKQEDLLLSLNISSRMFRISSAYGFAQGTTRYGLIDNLIRSALNKNNTLIYADPSTLRDYVFTQDIARFIIEDIVDSRPFGTQILASGRPISVDMLINSITQLLRKRVCVTYSTSNSNSKNIVFPYKLLPKNMKITSIEESIKIITMSRFFS